MNYRKLIQDELAKLHTANGMKASPLLDSDLGADIVADICRNVVNKTCNIPHVSDCQFEAYAKFCIECDRQGLKPIKYKDYLEIG